MIEDICVREKCTGCSACASVCPNNCIKLLPDEEGFLRPIIDEARCIYCDLCRKTCPINNSIPDDGIEPQTFAARIKDKNIRSRSSSGGLFSVFADQILEENGIVIAAGFDGSNQVVHKMCSDRSAIDELRRSKYVQSRIGTAFRDARDCLENGKKVLFCGTSCQIAGIKAYLGKEYDNLFTMDFICHGVPSPLAYNHYLVYLRKEYQSEIKEVNFRSKKRGWHTHSILVRFNDGREYCKSSSEDYFMRSFIMDMNLRPSCYCCSFKKIHRKADITIADFWGAEYVMKSWDDDTGISIVFIHSDKGKNLFDSCANGIEVRDVSFVDSIAHNPSMIKSVNKPPLRDKFMIDLNRLSYDKLHRKYCGTNIMSRIRRKVARLTQNKI